MVRQPATVYRVIPNPPLVRRSIVVSINFHYLVVFPAVPALAD